MPESPQSLRPWVMFGGCVLVVAVLYLAQAVFVPIALAVLCTFVLAPPTARLQRIVGRVPAILLVCALTTGVLGLAAWGITRQVAQIAEELPKYRTNIREKVADIRGAGKSETVEKLQGTLDDIQQEMAKGNPPTTRGTPAQPVVVQTEQNEGLWGYATWLSPFIEPLSTAALVVLMVIFMLIEREDLRDRLIGLFGNVQLAATTKALDEAAALVSRQLRMQLLVNVIYGVLVGGGLWLLGVPHPLLFGALGAALRFVPYVGPAIAAGAPVLISLAALPGWTRPLYVAGYFFVLELFTNMVLETALYAGTAGVSQVALIVSVAFWTWLWGPLGLLMAMPLTVLLVVMGKHVPGLKFLATLMADQPALAPDASFYQRLLARDQSEAADVLERYVKVTPPPPETVYDALLLPALTYAERDRLDGRISLDDEAMVIDTTRELVADAAVLVRTARAADPEVERVVPTAPASRVPVIGYATNGVADETALQMLGRLLEDDPGHARDPPGAHAVVRAHRHGAAAQGAPAVHRRSAAQPAVEDALPGQEAACLVPGAADRGRPLGAAEPCRRHHAAAARRRRHARQRDRGADGRLHPAGLGAAAAQRARGDAGAPRRRAGRVSRPAASLREAHHEIAQHRGHRRRRLPVQGMAVAGEGAVLGLGQEAQQPLL